MKIKHLFVSLIAALFCVAGCVPEADHYLSEIQVDCSYVSLPMDGGNNTIVVTANSSWSIINAPDWLTVSPVSGSAGAATVTFSAGGTMDGRETEVRIVCGDQVQNINVIQGLATVSKATCAEVIAGPDSKTYLVTGVCTAIANTNYGNWYLTDDTGQIYIYGTVNAAGSYAWSSFGIEVGDEVTVQGPKTTYNGTVELVDVQVIKVNKSLIKVASVDPEDATMPLEGGEVAVSLECKGNGISVTIPEDAAEWLSISSIDSDSQVVVFKAAPNEGGDRQTVVTFNTKQNGKSYSSELTLFQKGAIIEATIADFNAAEDGSTFYKLSGIITEVANPSYGNYYLRDWSGTTYVYGTGAKGDFEAMGLKAGDIVTIVGQKTTYKETIEVVKSTIESFYSVTEVTIPEFCAAEDAADVYYMVSGTVKEIANEVYGNLYLTDGTNDLYVYGTYPGWGATGENRKNFLATAGIQVGDKLTVIGSKTTYKETIEVNGGIYFSHESGADSGNAE